MQETQVLFLGWEDSLEKGTATTPVFLPGKSHGQAPPVHGVTKESGMTLWLNNSNQYHSWIKLKSTCRTWPEMTLLFAPLSAPVWFSLLFPASLRKSPANESSSQSLLLDIWPNTHFLAQSFVAYDLPMHLPSTWSFRKLHREHDQHENLG